MKKLFVSIALLVSALLAGGCLCFPPKDDPDPADRIGGPKEEKPPKKPPAKPPPPVKPPPKAVVEIPLPPKPDSEMCGAFVVEGTRMLWGLGVVNDARDPDLARKLADMRARKQIAVLIEYHIAAMGKHERPVIQWELTLENLEIADRWVDAEDRAFFAVAVVPLYGCGLERELADRIWESRDRERERDKKLE